MKRMGQKWTRNFEPGTTNTIDDATGAKMKRSQVRLRWDGYIVSEPFWNPRQPQDFPVQITPQYIFTDARGPQTQAEVSPPVIPII
jgi:hypothetical protein